MKALVLVDLQNDFMPGGALPVAEGDRVVPVANRLITRFDVVVATRDVHPPDHLSFASQHLGHRPGDVVQVDGLAQTLWPDHCIRGTRGAQFVDGLDAGRIDRVFDKGTQRAVDSYSGFFDNAQRRSTGLAEYLRGRGVADVFVMGLATDYCVKFTALDAVEQGFTTHLVLDGCRGVELTQGDVRRAIDEMGNAGIRIVQSDEVARR